MTNEELEEKLNSLESKLEKRELNQLAYPLDSDSVRLLKDTFKEETPDIIWNRYFYLLENPIVIDAAQSLGTWSMTASGGSFSGNRSGVTLKTSTTSGNYAGIIKDLSTQNIIKFNRQQEFRTAFSMSNVSDVTAYLVRGDQKDAENLYYGFKIVDGYLYGVTRNGETESVVDLNYPISASTTYDLDATLDIINGAVFMVRDTADRKILAKARLLTNLPTGTSTSFFSVYITTNDTTDKQLTFSYVEYMQLR